jgi:hypothetical protein
VHEWDKEAGEHRFVWSSGDGDGDGGRRGRGGKRKNHKGKRERAREKVSAKVLFSFGMCRA